MRYIYGNYGGFGVLFGGGGSSYLQVSCVVRLPFSFILPFSLRALSSRLVRAPSAAVFIAMDHGCAHTGKCEMLLKILSRFMMTSLYSEPIPVTEITSDWYKFQFPRDSRVITCVNLALGWRWLSH